MGKAKKAANKLKEWAQKSPADRERWAESTKHSDETQAKFDEFDESTKHLTVDEKWALMKKRMKNPTIAGWKDGPITNPRLLKLPVVK